MCSIGLISVDEDFFIEIAYKRLRIWFGDIIRLGFEWQMRECSYNFLILEFGHKEDIMFLINFIVEINVLHIFIVVYPLVFGEIQIHFLKLILKKV